MHGLRHVTERDQLMVLDAQRVARDAGVLGDSRPVQEALWRGATGHVCSVRVAQSAPGPDRAHSPGAARHQAEDLPTHAACVLIVPALILSRLAALMLDSVTAVASGSPVLKCSVDIMCHPDKFSLPYYNLGTLSLQMYMFAAAPYDLAHNWCFYSHLDNSRQMLKHCYLELAYHSGPVLPIAIWAHECFFA